MDLLSISAERLAHAMCVTMLATLATTYFIYVVVQKDGPAFLPMLSDTFVPAPGNYLSRAALSQAGLVIVLMGLLPYHSARQPSECLPRKLLLGMSTLAGTCLAVVGAVCESDHVGSCMGDDTVHVAAAVTLFVVYDVYMAVLSHRHHRHFSRAHRWLLVASLVVGVVCKLRFAPPGLFASLLAPVWGRLRAPVPGPGGASHSPVWLAVVEYLDTSTLLVWFATYAHTMGRGYRFGVVPAPAAGKGAPIATLARVRVSSLGRAVALLSAGTILLTFVLADRQGVIQPRTTWRAGGVECAPARRPPPPPAPPSRPPPPTARPRPPRPMISDLWWSRPGDMISRYAVCLCAMLLALTQLGHYVAVRASAGGRRRTALAHALSLLAAAGIFGVGCINEKENLFLHSACAWTFFGGFIAYMLVDLASSAGRWVGPRRAAAVGAAAVVVACKLAQWRHVRARGGSLYDGAQPSSMAYAEWLAFGGILAYFVLSTHTEACEATHLAFYQLRASAPPVAPAGCKALRARGLAQPLAAA